VYRISVLLLATLTCACAEKQTPPGLITTARTSVAPTLASAGDDTPEVAAADEDSSYVIGPDDVLSVVFWREADMSADVVVRTDGKISLPLLNDVQAAGLTPAQLRANLQTAAERFIADPVATVVVKEINSRKVFVTGMVEKPGAYPLTGPMTTLQLLATAGGFKDFADTKNIVIVHYENGQQAFYKFNYNDVAGRKSDAQDILLQPGDTVIVR
jgi:polysaccharide export outer membrane protein